MRVQVSHHNSVGGQERAEGRGVAWAARSRWEVQVGESQVSVLKGDGDGEGFGDVFSGLHWPWPGENNRVVDQETKSTSSAASAILPDKSVVGEGGRAAELGELGLLEGGDMHVLAVQEGR